MFVFPSLISVRTTDKYIGKNIQSGQIGRKVQIQKCFSSLTGGLEVSHIHTKWFLSTLNLTCGPSRPFGSVHLFAHQGIKEARQFRERFIVISLIKSRSFKNFARVEQFVHFLSQKRFSLGLLLYSLNDDKRPWWLLVFLSSLINLLSCLKKFQRPCGLFKFFAHLIYKLDYFSKCISYSVLSFNIRFFAFHPFQMNHPINVWLHWDCK